MPHGVIPGAVLLPLRPLLAQLHHAHDLEELQGHFCCPFQYEIVCFTKNSSIMILKWPVEKKSDLQENQEDSGDRTEVASQESAVSPGINSEVLIYLYEVA